ncbi:hypothetical protein SAMN04488515_1004 [Cognatiyoonia koreensis]|uniref:Uncharacterized protein n=1 Tax=Cognatiyoonia koreensis TaxID=364200 RepID=A0A1I0P510_9RHOB|nr:hypothetical protein [Cognatiyoonia koreensis]SEW09146.1 hypothetical protein SAMN04488515_1004 [Cognatiyoonia koreensis]
MTRKPVSNRQVFGRIGVGFLIGFIVVVVTVYQLTFGAIAEYRALAKLERVSLFTLLDTTPAQADVFVFQDGSDGWFAVTEPQTVAAAEIGIYGRRFLGEMFNIDAQPMYCGGAGKALWVVKDQRMIGEHAYCRTRRMDLSELRPNARAVRVVTDSLTMDEAEALKDKIASNTDQFGIVLPTQYRDYQYSFDVDLPYRWSSADEQWHRSNEEEAIKAAITAQFPELAGSYALTVRNEYTGTNTNYVKDESGTGWVPAETGPSINHDGNTILLTDIDFITHINVRFTCDLAACETLQGIDLSEFATPNARNIAKLDQAVASAIFLKDIGTNPTKPTVADLKRDQISVSDMQVMRYTVSTAIFRD